MMITKAIEYTNDYIDQLIEEMNKKDIFVFVDGSFNENKQIYGSGILFLKKNKNNEIEMDGRSVSGNDSKLIVSRNIVGEMLSVLIALKSLLKTIQEKNWTYIKKISFFYDYTGIENWFNNPKVKTKTNISRYYVDESTKLAKKFASLNIEICFYKIKSHSGQKYNEAADKLAKKAAGIL